MVDIKLESSKVQQPQGVNKSTDQQTMMMKVLMTLGCLLLAAAAVCALSMSNTNGDRRSFLQTQTSAAGAAAASLLVVAPKSGLAEEGTYEDFVTAESGLRYKVLKEGEGAVPSPGQTVKAHYTGWLDGFDDAGKKFDSSRDRGRPFTFKVATGQVIRGWDETFSQMKVGERRQIIIPPRLGYGDRGAGGVIPGGATLYFDVELLAIL